MKGYSKNESKSKEEIKKVNSRTIVCNDEGPWDGHKGPPDTRHRLAAFIAFVADYIFGTDEYKEMSPAVGGYL